MLGEWIGEALFDERVRFTGKDYDEVTGLYYFNARWYDPQLGRFTSEDPARDGMNWYAYVSNNPLRFIDPTELENVLINNEGFFPTIEEIDIGAGNFADGALAGLASVANIPSSLANMALQAVGTTLGAGDAVIDTVDNLMPDSMSLTGGGLQEDLFVTGLYFGMNPQTTSGFMLSTKHEIKSVAGKVLGSKTTTRIPKTFRHYGYADDAPKFKDGLKDGSYATHGKGRPMHGKTVQQKLALPHEKAPDAYYRKLHRMFL